MKIKKFGKGLGGSIIDNNGLGPLSFAQALNFIKNKNLEKPIVRKATKEEEELFKKVGSGRILSSETKIGLGFVEVKK